MKPIFCCLEDGTLFEGVSVNEPVECAGLLSFYTGVVGYQEVITDPANLGKIIVYTYPLIGNYGVNSEDAESASPKVEAILAKEYPPYYSNFRAEMSLCDYLATSKTLLGHKFDTRAMMVYMREHGEMGAVISTHQLTANEVRDRLAKTQHAEYEPENSPIACDRAVPTARAEVIDFGASRSFYRHIASLGIDAACDSESAEIVIVSDAPYYAVEDKRKIDLVKSRLGEKPILGFGHGCAIVAQACGAAVKKLPFGDHGLNIPVKHRGGGRNEITVQNHNYVVIPGGSTECLFTNIHDGTCEGFVCKEARAAGANFLPNEAWFQSMLDAVK
ncbi:MAG: carbamoyl-phosphate synthase domain-containing protein [Armatimonadota bacterium]|nr:carbamoyl-phosphate synthase domain-containing protein [Armatimonadota bacterium]